MYTTKEQKKKTDLKINTTYQNKTLEQEVKDEIERKGLASIKALSPKEKSIDSILKIMKEGDAEFKSIIGRELSYAEMREIYG
jgi:hypothetical protein